MTVEDIQRRINQLCEEGEWSVYKLAKRVVFHIALAIKQFVEIPCQS